MRLIKIEVAVWNNPNGRYTYIARCYTNPGREHIVRLYPNEVTTYLVKGNIHEAFKPGIQNLTRPL